MNLTSYIILITVKLVAIVTASNNNNITDRIKSLSWSEFKPVNITKLESMKIIPSEDQQRASRGELQTSQSRFQSDDHDENQFRNFARNVVNLVKRITKVGYF